MTTADVPYRFELDLEVPGTPAQVWHAIATAEGISAWMMPTELDAREGGALSFRMGPDDASHGRVTGFEPGRRFSYEEDWATLVGHAGAEVTPLATEFLVEARSGGTCVVRIVTSAFGTGAEWENEFFDEMTRGWAPMLDNLRLYLVHFPGQRASTMWVTAPFATSPEDAIAAVGREFGLGEVGDVVEALGTSGHLERALDRHFLVRLDRPVPGFFSFFSFAGGEGTVVQLLGHVFSDGGPAFVEREQPSWQAWLEGVAAEVAAARTAAG